MINPLPNYNLKHLDILIVEDNDNMRSLLREILRSLGVNHITAAKNGHEGLMSMQAVFPDIVICDWAMAGMNGTEFTKSVRWDEEIDDPNVPIIMLTGHTELHHIEEARDAGVTEYLAKPVSATEVYTKIVTVIERPRVFVSCETYRGPNRRRRNVPLNGPDRREKEEPGPKEDGDASEATES